MSTADDANRLSGLAREHLGADLGARWSQMLGPAARLVAKPKAEGRWWVRRRAAGRSVGWLGGLPTLPVGAAWPEWAGHGPLSHLATLDCAQLHPEAPDRLREAGFPAEGLLSFFYFDGSLDGGVEVVSSMYGTGRGARVVYTPGDVAVTELATPAHLEPYRRVELTVETVLTWPTWEHPDLHDGGRPAPGWDGLFDALDGVRQHHPGPVHQVGGNPDPVQGPVELEVSYGHVSRGGAVETAWTDPEVTDGAREWLLLAQFDSDDDAGFMWGDAGVLYFMIRPQDLAQRDFDQTSFTWQCG